MNLKELKQQKIGELAAMAREMGIENSSGLRKQELIFALLNEQTKKNEPIFGEGVLEILPDGFGFLRAPDYNYLDVEALRGSTGLNDIRRRCYSVFLSADAPNLFFLAPGVLESNTSTPWAYAHVAKSIMSHISGNPVFVRAPKHDYTNHFELVKMFAPHDRRNYPLGRWYAKYLGLALRHPKGKALPIP